MIALIWLGIPGQSRAEERFTFTDALNKTVTVAVPARRIVVLNSDAAEILYALGACDRIVGISSHVAETGTGLMPGLKDKPQVGTPQFPNLESIIELTPDLVISYEMWLGRDALENKLEPLGISVARIPCYRLNELERDIRLLGRISGKPDKAEAYIGDFKNLLHVVDQRLARVKEPVRVYAEGYGDYATVSRGIGGDLLLKRAGVFNIASHLKAAYPSVTAEWVVAEDPQVIVKALGTTFVKSGYQVEDRQKIDAYRQTMMNRPGWATMNAVKQGRVHLISSDIWTGPRAPIGIMYIASWCYPERFTGMDPAEFHASWLKTWYGRELKGVFVYP